MKKNYHKPSIKFYPVHIEALLDVTSLYNEKGGPAETKQMTKIIDDEEPNGTIYDLD